MLNYSIAVDNTFKALVDPTRRTMVEMLSRGPATVSTLAEPFDTSFAAVVQHLKVLEEAGLIRSEKVGRVRTCSLEPDGLAPLADWIAQRRRVVERQLDRLGEFLAESEPAPKTSQHKRKGKKQ